MGRRTIEYPPDVASKPELRALLSETDVFGPAKAEGKGYLDSSLERFRITMALLPEVPSGGKVLELGASPYFLTRLLRRRGLDVTAANWFGEQSPFKRDGLQRVVESGIPHEYRFDHFNIETDPFPYPDASFDVVLFCEILEHLPCDPTHTLVEIHRVLRPGGRLLVTTPNAARLENLIKCQRGENTYEALSGYGVYGRHNREYTLDELRDLLEGTGYVVEDLFARDIWVRPQAPGLTPDLDLDARRDNLFAVAATAGAARWYYPPWLYQSIHGYRRPVRPDVVVGVNCDLQLWGVHKLEDFGDRPGRWTNGKAEAGALLGPVHGASGLLRIEGRTAALGGTMTLWAEAAGGRFHWTLPCDGNPFAVEQTVDARTEPQTIALWCDRAFRPAEGGASRDDRVLGFVLHRVSIEPLPAS